MQTEAGNTAPCGPLTPEYPFSFYPCFLFSFMWATYSRVSFFLSCFLLSSMWSTYSRVPFIFLSLWSTYSIIPFFSFYPCYLFSNAAALFGSSALCGSIWHLLTKTLNVIPSFYLHLFRDTSWSFKRFFGTWQGLTGRGF